ncbi:MAG TPA: hypothetical protein VMB26_13245 [Candidatus Binataceae bacterium]|nr:hypothetical protein [Candidatus Binataceae bacterium]
MASTISTARGRYLIDLAGEPETAADAIILPLKLEHQSGLERVAFRCRFERALFESAPNQPVDKLIERIVPLIEREFEQIREQALKSIRNDKRLFELRINPGPSGPL